MKKVVYALIGLGLILSITPNVNAKVFRYPELSKPTALLPFYIENMSGVRIAEFIFESLVTKNKRGDIEGVLAKGWNPEPGNMGIVFTLNKSVKWHDNKPFTADDVIFTVKAAQNPKTIFGGKSKFDFIRSMESIGKDKVRFMFKKPESNPVERFTFKIIPKHAFKSTHIKRTDRFNRQPIGTGPYKVEENRLRIVKLKKFAGYWGKTDADEVMMQHTPDINEQINLLKYSGSGAGVHAVTFIPPKSMSIFENSDSVVLEPYHTVSWWYLSFNHKNKALASLPVRQAIALALDREELLEAHLGNGDILSGPFTESSPFYNFDVEVREQDLDAAKELLQDAGYKMKRGVMTKGKQKLKFKFVIDKDLPSNQALFLAIQAQLKKIGIIVQENYVDNSRYREEVYNKKRFDLTMNVWSFNELENIYFLFRSNAAFNFGSYSNSEVDAALDQSAKETDPKKYKEIMKDLHQQLNEDLPYVFLWSLDVYSGISRQLKEVFIQPYYYFTFFRDWNFK